MTLIRGSVASLILLLSLSAAAPAFAQDAGPGVGVLGMVTRNSVRTEGVSEFFDLESRTGWGAGLWFGGNKDGLFGFTGELIYVDRKVDVEGLEFRTRAVEIPTLLRLNIGSRSQNGLTVYAVGGPVFSWNLKQSLAGVELEDGFRSGDIGIMGGVGLEVFRIGIEGRGNWGQRSITLDGDFDEAKHFQFELVGKIRFN